MKKNSVSWFLLILLSFTACKKSVYRDNVIVDQKFNDYFHLKGDGFTGGDGTYSVLLPEGRTVWIFGDTFVGAVNDDNTRTKTDPIYIRNSFLVQQGDKFEFIINDTGNVNRSVMIPKQVIESNFETSEYDEWYWPGDGFVYDNQLKVFASKFYQVDTSMWGFKWNGTALFTFSLPDFKQIGVEYFEYGLKNDIHYGHAILEEEEYIYIYGLGNGKPYVARALLNNTTGDWEFFNGTKWSKNADDAKPMADVKGSEQFTVLKLEDKYYYFTQDGGLSPDIYIYSSDRPYTGWANEKLLYTTPLDSLNKNIFTYNAIVHPQFTNEKGILISYNTNSFKLDDHYKDAGIYRPRFIRVPLSKIIN